MDGARRRVKAEHVRTKPSREEGSIPDFANVYRRGKSAKLGGYREAGGKGVHDEAEEGVDGASC